MQTATSIQGAFGGGASDTVMHPVVAVAMVVAILCIIWLPRKYAIVPFLLAIFLLPVGQQWYLGGVHLYVPRIIILFGLARLATAKLKSNSRVLPGGWNDLDKIFTCWATLRSLAVILLNRGETGALVNQAAFLLDALGSYYFLRFLIRDTEDIKRSIKTFAIIVGILGFTMLVERFRGLNVFGYLGSVPLMSVARVDKIRAQGPFEQSILAGSFAATLLPFFLWLWQSKRSRLLAWIGIAGCTAMVFSCSSATPLMTYLFVFVGLAFWPLRGKMKKVRWVFLAMLVALALVMKAPVWYLIARVDIISGNSGYHRAELLDTFFRHFSDWWLIGSNQQGAWGFEMNDLCEQWVAEGGVGGLATLACFIFLIVRGFSKLGKARKSLVRDPKREWMLWLIGVALFAHCVGFFGISYFDQTRFAWYALFAIISAATLPKAAISKMPKRSINKSEEHEYEEQEALVPMNAFEAVPIRPPALQAEFFIAPRARAGA